MSKHIKWERFKNPLLQVSETGEVDSDSRVMVRATPFGPEGYKFNPDFPSEKTFVGHTNFDIDEEVKFVLDNTEGVERIDLISSYRFYLTVGKAFNSKRVRREISNRLCRETESYDFTIDDNTNIYRETVRLSSAGKPWAMYILPNGKSESFVADSEEDLEEKISQYERIRESIGGEILTS